MNFRSLVVVLALGAPLLGAGPIHDPRIAINAVNTPGDGDSVYLITAPGSYFLEAPLVGESGKHGIEIASSNVHVDLMGFPLEGVAASLSGVRVLSPRKGITVQSGTLSKWDVNGVDASLTNGVHLRDLIVLEVKGEGIRVGSAAVVERCIVRTTDVDGIRTGESSLVSNCVVSGAGGSGISVGSGSKVQECMVNDCSANGIVAGVNSSVLDTVITNCTIGIFGASKLLIAGCLVTDNKVFGVGLFSGTVRGCTVAGNGSHGIAGVTGVHVTGNTVAGNYGDGIQTQGQARIEDNDIRGNMGAGVRTVGTGSYVVKNTLTGNGSTLIVPNSGNFVGSLVHVNGTNGRSDPWANLHSN